MSVISSENNRPLLFGEVLFDSFPNGTRVPGGAPFNVAWHLRALGANPLLVSRVGVDAPGDAIRQLMSERELSLDGLQMDPHHPTGAVAVHYEQRQPVFEILEDQAYDFISATELTLPEKPGLLYHGSLALRNAESAAALAALKTAGSSIFVDVNLRSPWWDRDRVIGFLREARYAKLNEDELKQIAGDYRDVGEAARRCRDEWGLELLVVTLGADGAVGVGPGYYSRVAPDDIWALDPVGAGDGFTAVMILGLLRGWPLDTMLQRAQTLAGQVVQRRGATIKDANVYAQLSSDWRLD